MNWIWLPRATLAIGALLSAWFCVIGLLQLRDITLAPSPGLDAPGLVAFPIALSGYLAVALLRSVRLGRPPWSDGVAVAVRGFARAWMVGVALLFLTGFLGAYLRDGSVRIRSAADIIGYVAAVLIFSAPSLLAYAIARRIPSLPEGAKNNQRPDPSRD